MKLTMSKLSKCDDSLGPSYAIGFNAAVLLLTQSCSLFNLCSAVKTRHFRLGRKAIQFMHIIFWAVFLDHSKEGVWIVKEVCRDARTQVRRGVGVTDAFGVDVWLHQSSALFLYLFNILFDVLTVNVQVGTPWDMMYADYVVLVSESKEAM